MKDFISSFIHFAQGYRLITRHNQKNGLQFANNALGLLIRESVRTRVIQGYKTNIDIQKTAF